MPWSPCLSPSRWQPGISLSSVLTAAELGLLPRGWGDHQAHHPRGHPGRQPPPAPDPVPGGPGRGGGFTPIEYVGPFWARGGDGDTPQRVTPSFCKPPSPCSHLHRLSWLLPGLLPFAFTWLETWKMVIAKGFNPNISLS